MKHLKKWIIFLLIGIGIIIILLVILFIRNQTVGTDYYENDSFEQDVSHIQLNTELKKVKNKNNFYAIKNIIGKYAYSIIDEGKDSLYNMINPEYLSENNIKKEDILTQTENIKKENLTQQQLDNLDINVDINEMYYIDINTSIATYFAYGQFKYNVTSERIPFSIIIEMDSNQNTFYLYPTQYVKTHYPKIEDLKNYSTQIQQIPNNTYNEFSFINIEDGVILMDYLSKYKDQLIYDKENSYEKINSEYREAKFSNKEEYISYINEKMKDLLSISIERYKVDHKQDYKQYTFIDQKGNYYIFLETAIMEYTILLDSYTIDLEEFVEKYDEADNKTKVGMNTEKFLQALNAKDYKYIYNKLEQKFKINNFDTLNKFKEYMESKYPDNYNITYSDSSEENGIYIQPFTLSSKTQEDAEKIQNNIIMQLKEETDFVMSFTIE